MCFFVALFTKCSLDPIPMDQVTIEQNKEFDFYLEEFKQEANKRINFDE